MRKWYERIHTQHCRKRTPDLLFKRPNTSHSCMTHQCRSCHELEATTECLGHYHTSSKFARTDTGGVHRRGVGMGGLMHRRDLHVMTVCWHSAWDVCTSTTHCGAIIASLASHLEKISFVSMLLRTQGKAQHSRASTQQHAAMPPHAPSIPARSRHHWQRLARCGSCALVDSTNLRCMVATHKFTRAMLVQLCGVRHAQCSTARGVCS